MLGDRGPGRQGQEEVFHASGGDILLDADTGQRGTHGGDLAGGQPGHLGQRADARDDCRDLLGLRGTGVAEIVDLVGQSNYLILRHPERSAPLRHHLAGLGGGLVKGHAHLDRILGKARQFTAIKASLATGGHDGRDIFCGHWQAPRHLQHLLVHLLELDRRIEIDHLLDVGHR